VITITGKYLPDFGESSPEIIGEISSDLIRELYDTAASLK